MPHHALIGRTRCGKTTLGMELARRLRDEDVCIGVLDPFHNKWPCDFQTADTEKFMAALPKIAATRRRWAFFLDECVHALDRNDKRCNFLGTGAAQCGMESYFLAQDEMMLHPQIRGSVETWWVFGNDFADRLAKKKGEPRLRECAKMPPLQFFLVRPFEPVLRGQIIFRRKKVEVDLKTA